MYAVDQQILRLCEPLEPTQAAMNEADALLRTHYAGIIHERLNASVWGNRFDWGVKEELFEDVMLALVSKKALHRFNRQSKLSTYIATIAHRQCVNRFRKMARWWQCR